MKSAKKELWIGLAFLVLSVAYFLGSMTISSYSGYGNQVVDSKFMPRLLGVMMAFLSVIQIITSYRKLSAEKNAPAAEEPAQPETEGAGAMTAANPEDAKENFDEDAYVKGSSWKSFAVIAVLLVLYVAAFKPIGFILSSIGFLLATMLFLTPKEKRSWVWIIGLSVVIPIAVYFLFVSGFKLKLPSGILNF